MKIAIIGLGKMGEQIAAKLQQHGHDVIGYDIQPLATDRLRAHGVTPAYSEQEVVEAFEGSRSIVWLMVPATIIDSTLTTWSSLLPAGSIVIDGGNSDYRNDQTRADQLATQHITLLDIGTSGGVWGISNGFSMMVGGNKTAYEAITPILDTLAAPRGGYDYFGSSGSGHYVKMVHNAIEYGMMESLAEGYRMLKEGPYDTMGLEKAGAVWQQSSVITSWLNDLTYQTLAEDPTLEDITGVVAESGEARWTLETAKARGISLPAIQASLDVRLASQKGETNFATKLLAAMRNKFGGHNIQGE